MINDILHWFSHLFGNNNGKVVTYIEDDYIHIGFECDYCKKIDQKSIDKVAFKSVVKDNIEMLEES